jgi:hypothetical protein
VPQVGPRIHVVDRRRQVVAVWFFVHDMEFFADAGPFDSGPQAGSLSSSFSSSYGIVAVDPPASADWFPGVYDPRGSFAHDPKVAGSNPAPATT